MSDNISQGDNKLYLDKLKLKIAELKAIGYTDEAVESTIKLQLGQSLEYFTDKGFVAGSEMKTYEKFAVYADHLIEVRKPYKQTEDELKNRLEKQEESHKKSVLWGKIATVGVGAALLLNYVWDYIDHGQLKDDVSSLTNRVDDLEGRLFYIDQNITAFDENITANTDNLVRVTSNYNALNNTFATWKQGIDQNITYLQNASRDILIGEYDFARNLRDNVSVLQTDLSDLSGRMDTVNNSLSSELNNLREQLTNLTGNVTELERANLSARIVALNERLNNTEGNFTALQTELYMVWAGLNTTQNEVGNITDMLERIVSVPHYVGTNLFEVGSLVQSYSFNVANADGVDLVLQVGNTLWTYNLNKEGDNYTFAGNISDLILSNYILTGNFENLPVSARLIAYNPNGTSQVVSSGNGVLPSFYNEQEINEELLHISLDDVLRENILDKVRASTNISAKFGAYVDTQTSNDLLGLVGSNTVETLENLLGYTKSEFGNDVEDVQSIFSFFAKYILENNNTYQSSFKNVTRCSEFDHDLDTHILDTNPGVLFLIEDDFGIYGVNFQTGTIGKITRNPDGTITIQGDVEEIHKLYTSLSPEEKNLLKDIPNVGVDTLLWNGVFR